MGGPASGLFDGGSDTRQEFVLLGENSEFGAPLLRLNP